LMVFGGLFWKPVLGDDIGLEIVKAGLQLGVIGGLGGGVTFFLGKFESDRREQNRVDEKNRREQNRVDEYKLEILREVIASYNKIKSVRRILRAFGFKSAQATTLTPVQITEFVAQMRILNEAQLSLERINLEIKAQTNVFRGSTKIRECLDTVEQYINHVVQDWEKHGEFVWSSASSERFNSLQLQHLDEFLAESERSFSKCAGRPLATLVKTISSELLRGQRMTKENEEKRQAQKMLPDPKMGSESRRQLEADRH
jgi:hypothetical protein